MENVFEINAGVFVGTATNQPLRANKKILASATTTVTATFSPIYYQAEVVGTGNGVLTTFTLANVPVIANTQLIYLDGVLKAETTDYTFTDATGTIVFGTAPLNGVLITASYNGTTTKAIPMVAGQVISIGSACTGITSTAAIVLS